MPRSVTHLPETVSGTDGADTQSCVGERTAQQFRDDRRGRYLGAHCFAGGNDARELVHGRAGVDAHQPRVRRERRHGLEKEGVQEHGRRAAQHDDADRSGNLVRLRIDYGLRRRDR